MRYRVTTSLVLFPFLAAACSSSTPGGSGGHTGGSSSTHAGGAGGSSTAATVTRDGGGDAALPTCTPTCGTAVCGSDGCTDVCGVCDPSMLCTAGKCVAPPTGADVTVVTGAIVHPIQPEIYGLAFASKAQIADLDVKLNRYGGNSSTRYNWQLDVHNTGADWYFENTPDTGEGTYGAAGYVSTADVFLRDTLAAGAAPLMTIPTIGWTPKARNATHPFDCGYPKTEYATQASFDQWDPNCGNGKSNATTAIVATAGDALNTSTASDPSDANARVAHMMTQFGSTYGARTHFYQLDNEMNIWSGTHADVHPNKVTYQEVWDKTLNYAPAIRKGDPSAYIMGYGTWSTADVMDSNAGEKDSKYNGVPLMQWYLQQLAAHEKATGERLIDCLDLHPYPQTDNGVVAMNTPRTLWDPTYIDPSWLTWVYRTPLSDGGVTLDPVELIPRLRGWIQKEYPGLGICFTEYNFMPDDVNGAVIQSDALGIFGRQNIRLAAFWTVPWDDKGNKKQVYWAFAMYRNYDGAGGHFGDAALDAATTTAGLGVYAAKRSTDQAITVMLVNKNATPVSPSVALQGTSATKASVYTFVAGGTAITKGTDLSVTASKVTTTVPGYAVQLLVAK